MKKQVITGLLAGTALILSSSYTNAPVTPDFEGVITYTINMEGGDNDQVAQMMKAYTIKTYIKGDMCRTESNMGMVSTIAIGNSKKPKEPVLLINMMGEKYQLKIDEKEMKKSETNKPEIKYLTGTKKIAGYDCKEAQISVKDDKTGSTMTSDVYYTDQLPYNNDGYQNHFNGLKGFPLSYSMSQSGMNFTFAAQSIEKQSVPDSLFNVPAGYKLMSEDDMEKDIAKKMGGGQ